MPDEHRRRQPAADQLERVADGAHGLLAHGPLQAVEVEHPVEVVDLVLEAPRHQLDALDDDLLAVQVRADDPGVPGPVRRVPEPRDRQAALVAVLVLILRQLHDDRVEHVAHLVVDVPGERPQADPDLVRGQAGAPVGVDRLEQVLDEAAYAVVDRRDRVAGCAQDGVSDCPDLSHRHAPILARRTGRRGARSLGRAGPATECEENDTPRPRRGPIDGLRFCTDRSVEGVPMTLAPETLAPEVEAPTPAVRARALQLQADRGTVYGPVDLDLVAGELTLIQGPQ